MVLLSPLAWIHPFRLTPRAHTHSHTQTHKHTLTRGNSHRAFSRPSSDLPAVSDTAPMILCLAGCELSERQGMRRVTCDTARQDQMCHHLLKQRNKKIRNSSVYRKLICDRYHNNFEIVISLNSISFNHDWVLLMRHVQGRRGPWSNTAVK